MRKWFMLQPDFFAIFHIYLPFMYFYRTKTNTMNLEAQLLVEMSRFNIDCVAQAVGCDQKLFDQLWQMVLQAKPPIPWRAAWVMEIVSEKYPELVYPYITEIIEQLPLFQSGGLKRHFSKILLVCSIPETHLGILLNTCFEWLLSAKSEIAVRVHCMQLIYNISELEPDIKPELIAALETIIPLHTGGVQNRGKKLLYELYKEIG